jgi:formate dehydrogenase major subunit
MVKLTIDGKTIEVTEGTTVLRAAEQADVFIPTLCDHPHLSPYGGCRLCLVEVEGFRTLQPSCTLPASNNMVIHTDTPKIHAARKLVLSLIFSERNHFCPYCQVSGGDCELQNNAYLEGMTHWPIQPNWQPYEVDASHPYIILEHNRCILCRRCVRACGELVGNYTLGFAERGAASILVADLGNPLGESTCVSCGMCVQICPTGAIIDRSSAYQGLEENVERINTVCQGCSVGCGINVVVRDNRILRIEGNWDAPINQGLTCEIGRYKPLYDNRKRIETPMIRKSGKLVPTTWEEALSEVARHFKQADYSAIASSRLSVESLHALIQLFPSHTGIADVNSVLSSQSEVFEGNLSELDKADCFVVIGTDLSENQQVAGFMVKRAVQSGAELVVIDSKPNSFDPISAYTLKTREIAPLLEGLSAAILKLGLNKTPSAIKPWDILGTLTAKTGVEVDVIIAAAQVIGSASRIVIVYGEGALESSEFVKDLIEFSRISGALDDSHSGIVGVKGTANAVAASLLGLKTTTVSNGACYLALGDAEISDELLKSLQSVSHLVVQASYASAITESANVVLPAAIWAEETGHFINLEGAIQETTISLKATPGSKSNAEILIALAEKMGIQLTNDWQTPLHAGKALVALHP